MEKKYEIEYMCSYCGKKERKMPIMGRPMPGICSRRGKNMPHRWIINRKIPMQTFK